MHMPVQTSPLAIDLKELLRRALESKITRAVLVLQRAASLAMKEPEANLTDSDRALLESFIDGDCNDTPMMIGFGRSLSTKIQDKQLDRLITHYHRHVAEGQIRSEEAIRLGTHSGKPTVWELTLDLVGKAITNRTVGYSNPVICRELIEEYCWSLRQGERPNWGEGEEHINVLQREGFTRELLEELWKQCSGEAAELKLPRLDAATARQQGIGATTTPSGPDDEKEGDRGVSTPTNSARPGWRSDTRTTSEDPRLAAMNLKEILCRICKRAKRNAGLVWRRASLLAAQTTTESDVSDVERETLRGIGDGREALDVLYNDARFTTIARRSRNEAEEQIHREEADRLKRPAYRQTALQVVRDTFLGDVAQVVSGFTKPRDEAGADYYFAGYCNWLLDGTGNPDAAIMRAADILDTPDFRRKLLNELESESPEEAEELGLLRRVGGDAAEPKEIAYNRAARQRQPKEPVWERLDLRHSTDGSDHTAILDHERIPVRGEAAFKMLEILKDKKGERVKGESLKALIRQPPNRVYALFAKPLQRIIDPPGQGGTGYAMRENPRPVPTAARKSSTRRKRTASAKTIRQARKRARQR